jgi:hypothetical protein
MVSIPIDLDKFEARIAGLDLRARIFFPHAKGGRRCRSPELTRWRHGSALSIDQEIRWLSSGLFDNGRKRKHFGIPLDEIIFLVD